ncbi:siderophore ABC transporter substrate-binding protein [Tessaracoccus defluvii]|uniref:ABC transporter substrate-binding protein n=1 Tax=Tessaracoccus defluvii TaxID=1285901 RepID=A0A7H0H259_9ACTN|nr:ABC transporter substrate-binding protein [Tessaracoccus defluvii]QNP54625.1 ABC transporter substrate-binding protein [Tessaracoccus defluvii]
MKLHTRFLAATAAGLLALTTACGAGAPTDPAPAGSETPTETITVTHAQGTVELDGPAKRIVVLDHGSLDTVRALGASDAVVGVAKGQFLSDPVKDFADDTTYANVGTLQEPDFEKIAALEPDLIIAGFRSAKQQPELNKIAPTVDVTFAYDKGYYVGVEYATNIIAEALGKQDEAAVQLKELEDAIAEAKGKVDPGKNAMVLMTSGGKVSVHGTNSRYGVLFNDLGIEPTISDVEAEAHGDAISFEAIQQANPDIMFVVDRDSAVGQEGAAAQEVLDNELIASTTAWANQDVVYLDGARWYILIHGVDNAVEMMKDVSEGL